VNVPTLKSEEEKLIQYEMVVAGWVYPYEKFTDHCPNWDVVQQGGKEAKSSGCLGSCSSGQTLRR
jgi:hypothetical protein